MITLPEYFVREKFPDEISIHMPESLSARGRSKKNSKLIFFTIDALA